MSGVSGASPGISCGPEQFLCNNTLSNTILSINEWNYEGQRCIHLSKRCDGRYGGGGVRLNYNSHYIVVKTRLSGWTGRTWLQVWGARVSQTFLVSGNVCNSRNKSKHSFRWLVIPMIINSGRLDVLYLLMEVGRWCGVVEAGRDWLISLWWKVLRGRPVPDATQGLPLQGSDRGPAGRPLFPLVFRLGDRGVGLQ